MASTGIARVHCPPLALTTSSSVSSNRIWSSQGFSRIHHPHHCSLPRQALTTVCAISTPPSETDPVEEDILLAFFRDRELNGDFVTRASNMVFWRQAVKFSDEETSTNQPYEEVFDDDTEGGFLKLTKTQEWLMGENSPPVNKKPHPYQLQDDREKRKKLNFLKYDAIKKELLLLTVSVGAACSIYCLIVFSLQASLSYATGVAFSCLYLQLLYQHSDNISKQSIPQIFTKKKPKKIGIRSEDLEDFIERTIKGSGIALSSPRLVIPAAIFGLWVLSHQYITNDFFDFQIVPAMFGMFAYKAAALVQVYRDNEDLQFLFPGDEGSLE